MFIASALIGVSVIGMEEKEKPKTKKLPHLKKLRRRKRSHNLKVLWKPPEVKYTRVFPSIEKKVKD